MIRSLVVRDIRSRYAGSFMGFFWSVVHPLMQIILYYFIFAVIFKVRLGPEYGGSNYAFWLIAGLLPWLFFSETVMRAPRTVIEQASILKKTMFPSEIFPIVNLVAAMISHLISVIILIVFFIFSGYGISIKILLLFPYMLMIVIFTLGLSWILSALNVFVRDIGQVIGVVVNIWFYLTPVVYQSRYVPVRLQTVFRLNPMLHAIEGYRSAFLGKGDIAFTGIFYLLAISIIVIVIGAFTFRRLKPAFADVL